MVLMRKTEASGRVCPERVRTASDHTVVNPLKSSIRGQRMRHSSPPDRHSPGQPARAWIAGYALAAALLTAVATVTDPAGLKAQEHVEINVDLKAPAVGPSPFEW